MSFKSLYIFLFSLHFVDFFFGFLYISLITIFMCASFIFLPLSCFLFLFFIYFFLLTCVCFSFTSHHILPIIFLFLFSLISSIFHNSQFLHFLLSSLYPQCIVISFCFLLYHFLFYPLFNPSFFLSGNLNHSFSYIC